MVNDMVPRGTGFGADVNELSEVHACLLLRDLGKISLSLF